MKVLIVDDSADAVALARARLACEGLTLVCAGSGPQALAMAAAERPDLILLDVDMPDMSGFEVCRALKTDPGLSMVPVIFVSASDDTNDKVEGLDLGAVDYVTKPFEAFELRARVRAALRTKHLQDLLIQFSHVDPLTELWNRRALMERLEQEWARVQRYGGLFGMVMADLDHFKQINDRHGHGIGDKVLCKVSDVLRTECRRCDLPARYGGEEFMLLLPESDATGAGQLAERCRRGIESIRIPAGSDTMQVTASFGLADSLGQVSIDTLIRKVDAALYHAKESGRNRVEYADPCLADSQAR
jgi:two-component system, cell cycle response regulator